MTNGRFISIDWGTTSFRAALVGADGTIHDRVESGDGILSVQGQAFQGVLSRLVARWTSGAERVPVVMSGMIGSRQGWVEAPYLTTPVDLLALGQSLVWIDGGVLGRIALVPGVETRDASGVPDVMRGEETQVLGALTASGQRDGLFVLPGTHSKWVWVQDGKLQGFQTYMTGEVFAALRGHTILGRLMGDGVQEFNHDGFIRGVVAGAAPGAPGHLLSRVFAARTRGLRDDWTPGQLESYLSGLLIGAELAAGVALGAGAGSIVLIANAKLTDLYATAAAALNVNVQRAAGDLAVAGHVALARQGVFAEQGVGR